MTSNKKSNNGKRAFSAYGEWQEFQGAKLRPFVRKVLDEELEKLKAISFSPKIYGEDLQSLLDFSSRLQKHPKANDAFIEDKIRRAAETISKMRIGAINATTVVDGAVASTDMKIISIELRDEPDPSLGKDFHVLVEFQKR